MGQSQSTVVSQPSTQSTTTTGAGAPPPGCPMHQNLENGAATSAPPNLTEMASGGARHAPMGSVNPVNNIPELQQQPAPGQKMALSLDRTISSIPRANPSSATPPPACPVAHGNNKGTGPDGVAPTPPAEKNEAWEYPSPQQFYNALVRKGWETPEESIETIVNIHNWLNEEAWSQVRRWEEKHDGGDRAMLASFTGRPQDLSPKARYHLMMGRLFPNTYGSIRPFDRHDWIVHRPIPKDRSAGYTAASPSQPYTTHRYVIDYYGLPDDADGNPVFSLDVRPAVDSPAAVYERVSEWWRVKKETWLGADTTAGGVPGVTVKEDR